MIYYALLLFFVLEYVRPGSYVPALNLLRLNSLVPVAVILGTIVSKGPVSSREVLSETNSKIILGLLGLIFVSIVLTAEVTLYAYEVFKTVLGYVLVYWVITKQVTDLDRMKGLFKTLVFVHLMLAALTPQMFLDPEARHALASGTFLGDGNDYSLSVNLVIPYCLFLFFEARRVVGKLIWGGALLTLVLAVVATKSRGGTLALVCVGAYYWWKSDRKFVTGLLASLAIAAILVVAPPTYFERMNTISALETDGSAQGRLEAWEASMRMAASNPLLGVGAGQFPGNFVRFARPAGGNYGRWMTAHSIYFLILGELGLPGLGLLIGFIVSNIMANRRVAREVRKLGAGEAMEVRLLQSMSASVLAYAIAGAFLSATYYPHMFVVGGLTVAARRIARLESRAGQAAAPVPAKPAPTYHWAMRRAMSRGASWRTGRV